MSWFLRSLDWKDFSLLQDNLSYLVQTRVVLYRYAHGQGMATSIGRSRRCTIVDM